MEQGEFVQDVCKSDLFRQLGYRNQHEALDECLAAHGLTSTSKARISLAKRDEVSQVLSEHFLRVCRRGDCQALSTHVANGRAIVAATSRSTCDVCGGSAAGVALERMQQACADAGWTKICVVGGSPNTRAEISRTLKPPPEIRLVDGTASRTRASAKQDLAWADHVVLWGGTELAHKVSGLYHGEPCCSSFVRRSVQALWEHIAVAARRKTVGE